MSSDPRYEQDETDAAAAEAAKIGGVAGDEDLDPAQRPVVEAGGGEAEGFEDAAGLRDINTPESELASKQIAQTVNDAIAALPEELRTAITLRELDGLSYEEIAQIMNCPIGTVRSRIFRAREAVAEKLRPQLGTSKDKRW